jgi:dinuclear metal center YbgI/SA1388 family protein
MNKCTTKDIMNLLETLCPLQYAESWDNVGLLVGQKENKVEKVMVALDATDEVIEQAKENNIDLLITHHPLIFSPLKKVTTDDFIERRVFELIKNGISYYAMHTNFDVMAMADAAAHKLELRNTEILEVTYINKEDCKEEGIGRVGYLSDTLTLKECAEFVKERFQLNNVFAIGALEGNVNKVAISTGSGKSFVDNAISAKADVLITGDIDHHTAIDARARGLSIIDAGHFGTEHFMVDFTIDYLKNNLVKLIDLGINVDHILIMAANESNPFQVI